MNDFDTFFVSPEVHERTVELADGTKHILHFREVPATVFRKFQMDESSDDEDVRANSIARLIAASLCNADGSPAMSVEKAAMLKPNPSNAIFSAVLSVNGVGAKGKAQPPGEPTGSGTSSPLPSAAEQ